MAPNYSNDLINKHIYDQPAWLPSLSKINQPSVQWSDQQPFCIQPIKRQSNRDCAEQATKCPHDNTNLAEGCRNQPNQMPINPASNPVTDNHSTNDKVTICPTYQKKTKGATKRQAAAKEKQMAGIAGQSSKAQTSSAVERHRTSEWSSKAQQRSGMEHRSSGVEHRSSGVI